MDSPEEYKSVLLKGTPSHGLFGRGKISTVKVAVSLSVKKAVECIGCEEGCLHPPNTKGFESSNKHAGEIEWYT